MALKSFFLPQRCSLRNRSSLPAVTAKVALLLALGLFTQTPARAVVKLPCLFSHNMVLQQGMPVPVWGWADEGELVTVQFQGQRGQSKTKDGKWKVVFKNLRAGGPDVLTVDGRNRIQLDNIMVGEVWICSGQSNMQWPMTQAFDPQADILNSDNPNLRLFTVERTKSDQPLEDLKQPWNVGKYAWQPASKQSVPDFSAVAYYFGRELQKALKVPVGLIHTSWGGSPAEVWMSQPALEANNQYKLDIVASYLVAHSKYTEAKAKYDQEAAEAKKAGKDPGPAPKPPGWKPAELYNGMIHPLIPYAIKGAIWYQGESNAGRAHQYRTLFPDMIKNWRKDWGQGDFTFLAVQLAPFMKIKDQPGESSWAELREAQLLATKTAKIGLAVITDLGEENDIHPKKKAPVGERLALAARGLAYGEKIEYSGPVYKNLKMKKNEPIVSFDHTGQGLEARGGELKGFSICGADRKFVWGKAEIVGNTVVVTSPEVEKPVAVRFGWADYPVVNLWNKDGLPASPFRTDDFPMTTAPK